MFFLPVYVMFFVVVFFTCVGDMAGVAVFIFTVPLCVEHQVRAVL